MGFAYALFSIFFVLFFPRQITHVICFGRYRDQEFTKGKKVYYAIYTFWTLFFGILCLMMGSAAGVDDTFDDFLSYIELESGSREYIEAGSIYDENDYKHKGNFTLVYYIDKSDDVVRTEQVIRKIIEDNNSIYERYQLQGYELTENVEKDYSVSINGQILAQVEIEQKGLFKVVSYHWIREKLESNE